MSVGNIELHCMSVVTYRPIKNIKPRNRTHVHGMFTCDVVLASVPGHREIIVLASVPGHREIIVLASVPGHREIIVLASVPGHREIIVLASVPGHREIIVLASVPGHREIIDVIRVLEDDKRVGFHFLMFSYCTTSQRSVRGRFILVKPTAQLSTRGGFVGVIRFPSQGPGDTGRNVPKPRDLGEFQEHLETCKDTFYSKSKVKLIVNTRLHRFPTGNIIG